MAFGGRQPLTKVHCRVPYRTYERRAALSWAQRLQQHPEEAAASDADQDADEDSDGSDASDGSSTAPTKAHGVLATKRKVTFSVRRISSSIINDRKVAEQRAVLMHWITESLDTSCL